MKRSVTACLVMVVAGAAVLAGGGAWARSGDAAERAWAPARAGLEGLGFLAGTWSGNMGGDWVEETWSAPAGDSIIGMFRWQSAGNEGAPRTTTMWELLAITDEAEGPTLRLRHFDRRFMPWKSETGEEGVAALRATTVEKSRVVFTNAGEVGGLSSVEYACPSEGVLMIVVSFKDAGREALRFRLERAKK